MSVQLERSSRNGDRVWSKSYVRKVMMAEPVKRRIVYGALLLLTVCFLLQVFSPLRLNTDAIVLLSMAHPPFMAMVFSIVDRKPYFHRATLRH